MRTRTRTSKIAAASTLLAAMGAVHAAGGHHAVDDAEILKEGDCEAEAWLQRARGDRLLHGGLQCRVGPVELGAAGEYAREDPASRTGWELEAKWAREVAEGVSVGVKLGPTWAARMRPRHQGTGVTALATWTPRVDWAFHLNVGREFVRGDGDENRYGAAAEWKFRPAWSLVAERFRQESTHFGRAGLRWEAGRNWSVDLSRAQRLAGPAPSHWTIGVTVGLGDD